jgi:hypothetical protein
MRCCSTLSHPHTASSTPMAPHHLHPLHALCCLQGTTIRIEAEELDFSWSETRPGLIDSNANLSFKVKLVAKADLLSAQKIEAYGIDTKGARQQPAWVGSMPPACRASALVLVSWLGAAQPPAWLVALCLAAGCVPPPCCQMTAVPGMQCRCTCRTRAHRRAPSCKRQLGATSGPTGSSGTTAAPLNPTHSPPLPTPPAGINVPPLPTGNSTTVDLPKPSLSQVAPEWCTIQLALDPAASTLKLGGAVTAPLNAAIQQTTPDPVTLAGDMFLVFPSGG